MSTFRRWIPVLVAALPVACRNPVPEQRISGSVPVAAAATPSLAGGPWIIRAVARRRSYVVEQRAVLTTRTDSSVRIDSVSSRAELEFTLSASGAQLSGSVTAFRVQAPGRPPATPQGLVLPLAFAGVLSSSERQVVFTTPAVAAPCTSSETGVLHALRDLWFRPPDTLRLRGAWEDTATFAVCRDGILLRATSRRSFRVASAVLQNGRIVVSVYRSTRSALEGSGQQVGEPVEVTGLGSGELVYELDPETGELFGARGTSVLDLTLKSRLRRQNARQATETKIRPRSVDKP